MGAKIENQAYYDEFSDWYERERHRGYHALLDRLELGILAPIITGKRVLEAGCGTGLILRAIEEHATEAVGADLSSGMLKTAVRRDLKVAQANVTAMPFADETFDVVCSFKVLAHVEAIEAAVAELARVTRPGGHLVLEFYNPNSLRYLAKRLHPARISAKTTEEAVFTRWDTPKRLADYLPEGVVIKEVFGVRVFTPFALLHRVPGLGALLGAMERWALRSPLRRFGGFQVLVAEKL